MKCISNSVHGTTCTVVLTLLTKSKILCMNRMYNTIIIMLQQSLRIASCGPTDHELNFYNVVCTQMRAREDDGMHTFLRWCVCVCVSVSTMSL